MTIMDERGVITAHGPFEGLDRFEARPAVVGRAARGGPDRRRDPPLRARGRALQPVRHDRRAEAVPAVVRQGRAAGQGGRRRGPRRPGPHPPGRDGAPATSTGSTTCTTGASAASCGGGTGSRSGTARAARSRASAPARTRRPARAGGRTPTCSTPGSPPRCGRSPRWAGPTTPRTCAASIRPACWSPATTSCSSGSPG